MASQAEEAEVIVEEGTVSRTAILNRPRKLNALNGSMAVRLRELYESWEKDRGVQLVVIKGNGRAFCAGGDVAACATWGKQGEQDKAVQFFRDEYALNYLIGTFKKPHVALLHGIVMGGGNGLSMHGRFRVVTEKTVFAMPETALGLHPDVGASHFLSRLPGHFGEYLGLTGDRLDGADLVNCGLATHFVLTQRLPWLEQRLSSLQNGAPEVVGTAIDEFCDVVYIGEKSPLQKYRRAAIDRCFSKRTVEEIVAALEAEARANKQDEWYQTTICNLKKASPTSLKVTLRSIRQGRNQSLYQCLVYEFRLSARFMLAELSPDFYEGCRAILIDKDNAPKWQPSALAEVSDSFVNAFFAPLDKDLELPVEEREPPSTATQIHQSRL